ncbi:hypothetical protein ARMSODRAFT_1010887 [Armillaria solidipes]|uniref:Uncharacterized protein n=1 Tax=Armillaria solidipes TaxID=1076256 RepID=A0A2H3C5E1_9AGAR|nr:hypothetical protein ARMSODRAFT_1010887 [Armillaria solidipes]
MPTLITLLLKDHVSAGSYREWEAVMDDRAVGRLYRTLTIGPEFSLISVPQPLTILRINTLIKALPVLQAKSITYRASFPMDATTGITGLYQVYTGVHQCKPV